MADDYHHSALKPGFRLREWIIDDVLGAGGFAIVYRGTGVYFSDAVAIKEYFPTDLAVRLEDSTISPSSKSNEDVFRFGLEKFIQEAQILWSLSRPERHPNLLGVRALFEEHGTAYMIMDYEQGRPLSQLLREGLTFDEASLWATIGPVIEGLNKAHKAGVLHRDIKPANILIHEDGRPVLIDFGAARSEASQLTSKMAVFTPGYSAIEQQLSNESHGAWTDVYALAATFYQCMTGKMPPSAVERGMAKIDPLVRPASLAGYSDNFIDFVHAGLAVRPADRPQSLDAWLSLRQPTTSRTPKTPMRIPVRDETTIVVQSDTSDDEPEKRPFWHYTAVAAGVSLLGAGIAFYFFSGFASVPKKIAPVPGTVTANPSEVAVPSAETTAVEAPGPTIILPQQDAQQSAPPAQIPDPVAAVSRAAAALAGVEEKAAPPPPTVIASLPSILPRDTSDAAPSPPTQLPVIPPAADLRGVAQLPDDPASALSLALQSTATIKEIALATMRTVAKSRASSGDKTRCEMLLVGIQQDRNALEKLGAEKSKAISERAASARVLFDRLKRRFQEIEKVSNTAPQAGSSFASTQIPRWDSERGSVYPNGKTWPSAPSPEEQRRGQDYPSILMKMDDLSALSADARIHRMNAAQVVLIVADMTNIDFEVKDEPLAEVTKNSIRALQKKFLAVMAPWNDRQGELINRRGNLATESTSIVRQLTALRAETLTALMADRNYSQKKAIEAGLVPGGNAARVAEVTQMIAQLVADSSYIANFARGAGVKKDDLNYIEQDAGSAILGLAFWRQDVNRASLSDAELRAKAAARIDLAYEDREEARLKARRAKVPVLD
jgi:serine/threonine protein kinase